MYKYCIPLLALVTFGAETLRMPTTQDMPIHVKWYGARGGTNNDTAAIQAAIDAASSGAHIRFGESSSTYTIRGSLTISKPLTLESHGATLRLVGTNASVMVSVTSSNTHITGLTFDTDQSSSAIPVTAILVQGDNCNNIRIDGNTLKRVRIRTKDANSLDQPTGCKNLWIDNNTFQADYTGCTGGDTANIIDVRGYDGVSITGNRVDTKNEERFIHMSGVNNYTIAFNKFNSTGQTLGGSVIDTFANCRYGTLMGNTFNITNSTYGVVFQAKPTSSIFSDETDIDAGGNVINFHSTAAYVAAFGVFGSWGLNDQEIVSSQANIHDNQIHIWAPNSNDSMIAVRGFTHGMIVNNIITRPDRGPGYVIAFDGSNNKNCLIQGNSTEYGRIMVSGASSSPSGQTYPLAPQNITIANNIVHQFDNLGGIYITSCTNVSSITLANNTLNTVVPFHGFGVIHLDHSSTTNLIINGTSGSYDTSNYIYEDTISYVNKTTSGNNWQGNTANRTKDVTQSAVDFYADFANSHEVPIWIVQMTTNIVVHATNCAIGRELILRLRAGTDNRTVSFDSSFVKLQPWADNISSNHTAEIRLVSHTVDCGNANVTAEFQLQHTEDYFMQFRNLQVERLLAYGVNTGMVYSPGNGYLGTRTLTEGDGITITDGDGVNGNPTFYARGKTRVTALDSTAGYLSDKIVGSGNIVVGILNSGGNEQLYITNPSTNITASTNYNWIFPITQSNTNVYIATNGIAYNLLAQGTGLSILGRYTNTVGNVAEIVGTSNGQALQILNNNIGFYPTPVGISTQRVTVLSNSTIIGSSYRLNFIPGANTTIEPVDTGSAIDITISSSGTGGGGGGSINTTDRVVPVKSGTNFLDSSIYALSSRAVIISNSPSFTVKGTNGNNVIVADNAAHTVTFPDATGYDGLSTSYLGGDGKYHPLSLATTSFPVFGYTNIITGDYPLTTSWADVTFDGHKLQTDVLQAGTYTVTVSFEFHQYRDTGPVTVQLWNTEIDSYVDGSMRYIGMPVLPDPSYIDWVGSLQARVTITTSGRIKFQAITDVAPSSGSYLKGAHTTMSWSRDTTTIDSLTATTINAASQFNVNNIVISNNATLGNVPRNSWPSGGGGTNGSLKRYIPVLLPDGVDGTGCTRWPAPSTEINNRPSFSGTTAASMNYAIYNIVIPDDFDNTQDLVLSRFRVMLNNTDTQSQTYFIAMYAGGDNENEYPGTVSNQVTLTLPAGATTQFYQRSKTNTTLTNWKSAISPGDTLIIKVSRDGANDASTVASTVTSFVLSYTSTGN